MIQMKVCVKKGSVLIPAGDSLPARSLLTCQMNKQADKVLCFLITFKGNKFCLLLPLWWEDLRGMKPTITVRLVRAQPALSLQQRSEGAGTFSMTPATQRRRLILLSVLWPFVLLFTPVYQFPLSFKFKGLGMHSISIKKLLLSPEGMLEVQV